MTLALFFGRLPACPDRYGFNLQIRHLRNDTLKPVGEQFRVEKHLTVNSMVERVKYDTKVGKGLKKRIQNLAEDITKSQRQS